MTISADAVAVVGGATGLAGGGATVDQVNTAITAALAALTIPDEIADLDDFSGTPATGDLLQWDGTDWVPYTPTGIEQTFLLPFSLDGDGSAIAAGTYYASGIPVPSACEITGWRVRNTGAHTIVTSIQRCPVGSNTWTTISGSEGPSTTLTERNSDTALTTWTVTDLAEGDSLRVVVASGTAVESTVSVLLTRTLTWS